jgi:hypothetical protein
VVGYVSQTEGISAVWYVAAFLENCVLGKEAS